MFRPVDLEWKGKIYTIPSDKVMGLVAVLEVEVATVDEWTMWRAFGKKPRAKMAQAYATCLTYAGCPVKAEDVHLELWHHQVDSGNERKMDTLFDALLDRLYQIMIPAPVLERMMEDSKKKSKKKASKKSSKKKARKKASSNRGTKRR